MACRKDEWNAQLIKLCRQRVGHAIADINVQDRKIDVFDQGSLRLAYGGEWADNEATGRLHCFPEFVGYKILLLYNKDKI